MAGHLDSKDIRNAVGKQVTESIRIIRLLVFRAVWWSAAAPGIAFLMRYESPRFEDQRA